MRFASPALSWDDPGANELLIPGTAVGADATHVRLGQRPFRQKLRRLRRVLDRLQKRHDRAAYVYLDNRRRPDRVTVKLR